MDKVKVLATGQMFLKSPETILIGRALNELMDETRTELQIVAYRFTTSVQEFRDSFERVLHRGCNITLVLDQSSPDTDGYSDTYVKSKLKEFKNLTVWDFTGLQVEGSQKYISQLHAKTVISDRKKAVVGSANFSRNGLLENHELALLIEGEKVLTLAKAIDELISNGRLNNSIRQRLV
jgi:cardiolipin synthase